jgi:hypothetical protein
MLEQLDGRVTLANHGEVKLFAMGSFQSDKVDSLAPAKSVTSVSVFSVVQCRIRSSWGDLPAPESAGIFCR